MKRIVTIFLALVFIGGGVYLSAKPQGNFMVTINCALGKAKSPDKKLETLVLKTLKQYYKPGLFMINSNRKYYKNICNRADDSFLNFLEKDKSSEAVINRLHVIVHEEGHAFNWLNFYQTNFIRTGDYYGTQFALIRGKTCSNGWYCEKKPSFYFEDKGVLFAENIKSFPPKEMADSIKEPWAREGRFTVYVSGEDGEYGQSLGINWLLDEYHAYYHGDSATLSLARSGVKLENNAIQKSYLEFTYYMLHYFIFAEKKHPKVFKQIMQSPGFLKVFIAIHDRYQVVFMEMTEEENLWNYDEAKKKKYQEAISNAPYSTMMERIRKKATSR
ncbi:MAG: hypothetical protein ABUK01_16410 [Leptospirales bacterium]